MPINYENICPVDLTLSVVGNKWAFLIIRNLLNGTQRFGELKKGLDGISQKVLTANLKKLEENGLVSRKVYPVVPPKVEYSLTTLGYTLKPVMDSLRIWGETFQTIAN
ncbi:winged helix-turn-helix transcriptional regulator [[Acholeplasma] multilocale]|uniref:winged helix-turn-helix transcriptional regulator n=1 Tax=[Acholeplasma] multilocale TaxID=264638 RepID=UPI0005505320|nr:helix-turn-helix domain-containing protein [[Acholeplasma] multilocale]